MLPKLLTLRKELHQHPELSGQETKTAERIKTFIETHHPTTIIEKIGGNGLAAVYEFSKDGPTIMIRCELDALPIQEVNTFPHRSKYQGVAHKCGHDGHITIVVGLIFWLKKQNLQNGKVILLFQPGEETGQGAAAILNDPKFEELQPDYIFALHNIPSQPLHTIILVKNNFSPSVQSLSIHLQGKKSHASEPENGINPALAIADLVHQFEQLKNTDQGQEDFALLTPVFIEMGQKAYGISAGKGEVHYTIRTWTEAEMKKLSEQILNAIEKISQKHQLAYEVKWFDQFPTTVNDDRCNQWIATAANNNDFTIYEKELPFKFGEDFGWFSQKYPSAMFGLGAGIDSPALHHAEYDFPDELIPTGIKMFGEIIRQAIKPMS